MFRGKVTAVTSAGVYVQTAEFGTLGPCQYVGAKPKADDMVVVADMGADAMPDLVVLSGLGRVTIDDGGFLSATRVTTGVSSSEASLWMVTSGGTARWKIYKDTSTESGSNSGSHLVVQSRNDSGGGLSAVLTILRDTGKIRIGNASTTAGIELGSSGPTITSGTGAPTHTPPNGSVYLRTDGTATTTLYVRAGGAWTALS